MRHHQETRGYVERRRQERKSDREIRRCLKRYLARRFFKLLQRANAERMFAGAPEFAA
jgi:hypothetical protein